MRRFLFTFPAAVSLLLCAIVLAAWALSHCQRVSLTLRGADGHRSWRFYGDLSKGAIFVRHHEAVCNLPSGREPLTIEWKLDAPLRLEGQLDWKFYLDGDLVTDQWQHNHLGVHAKGYCHYYGHGSVGIREQVRYVLVPLWAVAVPFAVLPAAWLLRARPAMRRRRLKAGLCIQCGYNLRASTDRCPECGTLFGRV